jgi:hypothetical protein
MMFAAERTRSGWVEEQKTATGVAHALQGFDLRDPLKEPRGQKFGPQFGAS